MSTPASFLIDRCAISSKYRLLVRLTEYPRKSVAVERQRTPAPLGGGRLQEVSMCRRMADRTYRAAQWENRYASHIKPINDLVDSLIDAGSNRWVPYVDPIYGGVDAELLCILQDPGPMTLPGTGSGFISHENDDPTAERLCKFMKEADISPSQSMLWNAYPWYINKKPSTSDLKDGIDPLMELVKLLPRLKVVMLNGLVARSSWRMFERKDTSLTRKFRFEVIETYHTSNRAMALDERKRNVKKAFENAAKVLRLNSSAM